MTIKRLLLVLFPCAIAAAADTTSTGSVAPNAALDHALQEFKKETEALGIRLDPTHSEAKKHGQNYAAHGRIFENFRNDVLDAVPHEIKQRGQSKSLLQRNQFGFNVSGPVVIPRVSKPQNDTFFSLSYEGVRERVARTHLRTVPTLAERSGDFSQTVDQAGNPLSIYDPATTSPNPNYDPSAVASRTNLPYLRSPFSGNRIPVNQLDPVASDAVSLYPAPNASVGPFFQNNFFINAPETNIADGFLGTIEQNFGEQDHLTFSFNVSNGLLGSARWFPSIANPGAPDRIFQNQKGSLNYVFALSPRTVNTASFIASTSVSRSTTGTETPYPVYQIDPYLNFGTAFPDSRRARNTFDLSDGLSTRHGSHSIHINGRLVFYQLNVFWPQYPSGYFDFSPGVTSLPSIVDTGHAFASFLLGQSDYAERTVISAPSYFRETYGGLGISDKYALSKNFAITVGVNATRYGPRTEKYNRQSTIDPGAINTANELPGALVFAGRNGVSRGLRPAIFGLDPSIGVVWNPGSSLATVIRASYSRSHQQMPMYSGQWATQGFNARQAIQSPNNQLTPAIKLAIGLPSLPRSLPDLTPDAANGAVADWMDLTSREPVYQSASLAVEQQLPFSLVVTMGAYHQGGCNLFVGNGAANPNAISPDALVYRDRLNDQNFSAQLRPFPQYTSFDLFNSDPAGRYQRDAAYVQIEKRASNGLTISTYYEFGRQFDDYSGSYGVEDSFNRHNDWALTPGIPPQSLQITYAYELPFGANKSFLNYSDWRRLLVNGWSVMGAAYIDNGTPLLLHPEFNNTGSIIPGLTVNTVPGIDPTVPNPGPSLWFNPGAFDQPADFTLGNASRTSPILLSPGTHNFDVSVVKRVAIGQERSVEFRATGFNFLNHGDWNYPDIVIGSESAPNLDAGKIIGSHGARVIQLGLMFNF